MFALPRLSVPVVVCAAAIAPNLAETAGVSPGAGDPPCAELSWSRPDGPINVILIVNDTMRRDRVGIYGGPARTPAFDRFARENLRFDAAFTQAPWTKPSMATLFTSLYPSQHGVLSHPELAGEAASEPGRADVLPDALLTLPEIFAQSGYRTGAFVGNPWLGKRYGFGQGFDTYDDSLADWEAPGGAVSAAGLEWLAGLPADEPFFLYLHYMDTHRPYGRLTLAEVQAAAPLLAADSRPVAPNAHEMISQLVWLREGLPAVAAGVEPSIALLEMAYDRGVERFDAVLGRLLKRLSAHRSFPRTAILVTSDHGEALFDRGYGNHGNGLHDDELAIPLAARLPGVRAGGPVSCPVGLIDLLPTLCTYLGEPCAGPVAGRSFLRPSTVAENDTRRHLVAEAMLHEPTNRAVRNGRYKLIWMRERSGVPGSPVHEIYDLANDPDETDDLLRRTKISVVTRRLFDALMGVARRAAPSVDTPRPETVPLDPDEVERLKSLGYLN